MRIFTHAHLHTQKMRQHIPWSDEEDALLIKLQKEYSCKWSEIARHMPGRRFYHVQQRWNSINPDANRSHFTQEEDAQIRKLIGEYGTRWVLIAAKLGTKREPIFLKSRYRNKVREIKKEKKKAGEKWTRRYGTSDPATESNEGVNAESTTGEEEEGELSLIPASGGESNEEEIIGIVEPEPTGVSETEKKSTETRAEKVEREMSELKDREFGEFRVSGEMLSFKKINAPTAGGKIRFGLIDISSLKQPSVKKLVELADEMKLVGMVDFDSMNVWE